MRLRAVAGLTLILVCVGCGGGGGGDGGDGGDGGGSDPVYDLNGWWEYQARTTDSGNPFALTQLIPIAHSGTSVVFNTYHCTLTGSVVTGALPNAGSPDRSEVTMNVLSNDVLDGASIRYVAGEAEYFADLHMLRTVAPTGTLLMNGKVGTVDVDFHAVNAYGHSAEVSSGPAYLITVRDASPESSRELVLLWDQLPPILPDTYHVGGNIARIRVRVPGSEAKDATPTGFVQITSHTTGHVTGLYDLDLEGGTNVTGTFDVDILIRS